MTLAAGVLERRIRKALRRGGGTGSGAGVGQGAGAGQGGGCVP
jgi:hypothetical protein